MSCWLALQGRLPLESVTMPGRLHRQICEFSQEALGTTSAWMLLAIFIQCIDCLPGTALTEMNNEQIFVIRNDGYTVGATKHCSGFLPVTRFELMVLLLGLINLLGSKLLHIHTTLKT